MNDKEKIANLKKLFKEYHNGNPENLDNIDLCMRVEEILDKVTQ